MGATFRLSYVTGRITVDESANLVFGHLARIAAPIVRCYWSDLYHDAMWLQKHMTGESFTFAWSVDDCGTLIGTDTIAAQRDNRFIFTVTAIDGETRLKIVDMTDSDMATIAAALS